MCVFETSSFYSTLSTDQSTQDILQGLQMAQKKKALVIWGTNLTSQVGSGRFTFPKQVSHMIALPRLFCFAEKKV
jgi:hypothetical protein